MGNSSNTGSTGHTSWVTPPNTGGPEGGNNDSGDPYTPRWFVGDTRGTLGHQDHADPDGRVGEYLSLETDRLRRERDIVKRELIEALRIREAYVDTALLEKARTSNWSAAEFDAAV